MIKKLELQVKNPRQRRFCLELQVDGLEVLRFFERGRVIRRMGGSFEFREATAGFCGRTPHGSKEFLLGYVGRAGAGEEDAAR